MTDEDIRKIAEEYSLYHIPCTNNKGHVLSQRLSIEKDAQTFLRWLSERYCIVEKSKIQAEYKKSYSMSFEPTTCLDRQYARGRHQVLREIFGKGTFNESTNHHNTD